MYERTVETQVALGTALIILCLCQGSVSAQQVGSPGAVEYSTFTILITDPEGKPIPNASVYKNFGVREKSGRMPRELTHSDENGIVEIGKEKIFRHEFDESRGVMVYVLANNELAGFLTLQTEDIERPLALQLKPVCLVHGQLTSSALEKLHRPLEWTNVYLHRDSYRPLFFMPEAGRFEFLLPPGWYRIHAYGTGTYTVDREFEIEIGQKELTIDLDLPADTLASLMGKPAPELRDIKGWINSKPMALKDLRGKVVLLDFWGIWCGPCLTAMPELVDLHEQYSKDGLAILAVHDDSLESTQELREKLREISRERWEGMDIPFPIALDGGGEREVEGRHKAVRGATTGAYGINSWPTCVLIDREGNIVKKVRPGSFGFLDELEEALGIKGADNLGISKEASRNILMRLGLGAHNYVRGHRGRWPDSVARARALVDRKDWQWLDENVVYLGKGITTSVDLGETKSGEILAYDRSLLENSKSYGTNVLFTNLIVQFKDLGWLKKRGIERNAGEGSQSKAD